MADRLFSKIRGRNGSANDTSTVRSSMDTRSRANALDTLIHEEPEFSHSDEEEDSKPAAAQRKNGSESSPNKSASRDSATVRGTGTVRGGTEPSIRGDETVKSGSRPRSFFDRKSRVSQRPKPARVKNDSFGSSHSSSCCSHEDDGDGSSRGVDITKKSVGGTSRVPPNVMTGSGEGSPRPDLVPALDKKAGDEPAQTMEAVRYAFSPNALQWRARGIKVRVLHPNRPMEEEDTHILFSIELLDDLRAAIPMIGRVLNRRYDVPTREDDYLGEGQSQFMCEEFVRRFHTTQCARGKTKPDIPLLTNRCVVRIPAANIPPAYAEAERGFFSFRTEDCGDILFMMEPNVAACNYLRIPFEMDGMKTFPPNDKMSDEVLIHLTEAFSHFTYNQSFGAMVVTGLQRDGGYLQNPVVLSINNKGFGPENTGLSGIQSWAAKHVCNPICGSMVLKPQPRTGIFTPSPEAQAQMERTYYVNYANRLQQCRPVCALKSAPSLNASTASNPGSPPVSASGATRFRSYAERMAAAVTVSGLRYSYNTFSKAWQEVPVTLRVTTPDMAYSEDEMYHSYRVEDIRAKGGSVDMLAKILVKPSTDKDYYDIADASALAAEVAHLFKQHRMATVKKAEVRFLPRHVVRIKASEIPEAEQMKGTGFFSLRTQDSMDMVFVMEAFFDDLGNAALDEEEEEEESSDDPNEDDCFRNPPHEKEVEQVEDSFAHFSFLKSNYNLVVCDLRLSNGLVADFHINTFSGEGFGPYNLGREALDKWIDYHKCSYLCELLGFQRINYRETAPITDAKDNSLMEYVEDLRAHRVGPAYGTSTLNRTTTFGSGAGSPTGESLANTQSDMANTQNSEQAAAPRPKRKKAAAKAATAPRMLSNYGTASSNARTTTSSTTAGPGGKGKKGPNMYSVTKHTFDPSSKSWTASQCTIKIANPDRVGTQMNSRTVYDICEVDSDTHEEIPMSAKVFSRGVGNAEKDYFGEALGQYLCYALAEKFNAQPGLDRSLQFIRSSVVVIAKSEMTPELNAKRTGFFSNRTSDTKRVMFLMEPKQTGKFTKYTGPVGESLAKKPTPMFNAASAFGHYTLEQSGGVFMVTEIQGVLNQLSDPGINTYNGVGLCAGNKGKAGLDQFAQMHVCNDACKLVGLQSLAGGAPSVTPEEAESNEYGALLTKLMNSREGK